MTILDNFEEDMVYEVLISTKNEDGSLNVKPFGLKIKNNSFVLKLFPNKTFLNIKNNLVFTVYFLQDVLMFTKALTSNLDYEEFLNEINYEIPCKISNSSVSVIEDNYGKNITTTIIAEPIKIIEHKETLPIINRASNKIMELLIDFSRYDLMDVDAKSNFIEKINSSERIIRKTGNGKHLDSLNLLKKELKE
ncbi:MAG: DUF447 family protein [Methanosphaera stadtmanae]|nr:DUF447 family protein [Methanosphaera stadtmanae]